MTFKDIKGNDDVIRALAGMVDSGRIPHAIMFNEDDGGGAFPICLAFLNCLFNGGDGSTRIDRLMHPDIHFIFPIQRQNNTTSVAFISQFRALVAGNPSFSEMDLLNALGVTGKQTTIAVDEANYICSKLAFNSLEGGFKAVVIYLPEKMNAAAANKLLKTLEEPSEKTVILLITHNPEGLLSTISSRCLNIRVRPARHSETNDNGDEFADRELFDTLMEALVSRNLSSALDVSESLAALPSRERASAFCQYASGQLRKIFLTQQGMSRLAGTGDSESGKVAAWANSCRKTFPRQAASCLDRAVTLIERNVNMKILFCDLVNRMFLSI